MKRFFVLAIFFVVVLGGCEDEDADFLGTWYGNYGANSSGEITMTISKKGNDRYDSTWALTLKNSNCRK